MNIFEWVEDIEETYKFLINKAEEENQNELETLRSKERENMKKTLKEKNEYVHSVLKGLSESINSEKKQFEEKIDERIKKIEDDYEDSRSLLIQKLIKVLNMELV